MKKKQIKGFKYQEMCWRTWDEASVKNQTAESFGKKLKTAKKNSGEGSADDAVCCPQSTSSI